MTSPLLTRLYTTVDRSPVNNLYTKKVRRLDNGAEVTITIPDDIPHTFNNREKEHPLYAHLLGTGFSVNHTVSNSGKVCTTVVTMPKYFED